MADTFDHEGRPLDEEDANATFSQDELMSYVNQAKSAYDYVDQKVGVGPASLLAGVALLGFGAFKVYSTVSKQNKS